MKSMDNALDFVYTGNRLNCWNICDIKHEKCDHRGHQDAELVGTGKIQSINQSANKYLLINLLLPSTKAGAAET